MLFGVRETVLITETKHMDGSEGIRCASPRGRLCRLVMKTTLEVLILLSVFARAKGISIENSASTRWLQSLMDGRSQQPLVPLSGTDVLGFALSSLSVVLAAGGGIGGGGMLIPIYVLVMGFTPKRAIPLSNVTVLGGSIANTILNARKRHPSADRPLIDWDFILVMEPLTISGALLGSLLHKVLREVVLVILLILVMGAMAVTTLRKAQKMHQQEDESAARRHVLGASSGAQAAECESGGYQGGRQSFSEMPELETSCGDGLQVGLESGIDERPLIDEQARADSQAHMATVNLDSPSSLPKSRSSALFKVATEDMEIRSSTSNFEDLNASLLEQILDEERSTPWRTNVCIICSMFVTILFINVAKGGGGYSPFGIVCGSLLFWLAKLLMNVVVLGVFVSARSFMLRRTRRKQNAHYPYKEDDVIWDERATIVYPLNCFFAGLFAGMFGIGGGILKGPLMLAMGVHPAVASATSACMILFTSSTATTSYSVFGLLPWDYALICFAVGFVATLLGQTIMSWLLKKFKRTSYIAFSIGVVVLLSAILMTVEWIVREGRGEAGGLCNT